MPFADREDAARRLVAALRAKPGLPPLVLAVPGGAVPIACAVAGALGGEADVVLCSRVPAPGSADVALGSVDETGHAHLTIAARELGPYLATTETRRSLEELRRLRARLTPGRERIDPRGRDVVLVDDGTSTRAALTEALRAIAARVPTRLVAAIPAAEAATIEALRPLADEVVWLELLAPGVSARRAYARLTTIDLAQAAACLRARGDPAAPAPPG